MKPNRVTLFIVQNISQSTHTRYIYFIFQTHPRCQHLVIDGRAIFDIKMQQVNNIFME